jgi:hypothetical protein
MRKRPDPSWPGARWRDTIVLDIFYLLGIAIVFALIGLSAWGIERL